MHPPLKLVQNPTFVGVLHKHNLMKRYILLLFLLSFFFGNLGAKSIDPEQARTVAETFFSKSLNRSQPQLEMVMVEHYCLPSDQLSGKKKQVPLFYIFRSQDNQGFVIVAGDDLAYPILGYSALSPIDLEMEAPNLRKWLEECKKAIRYATEHQPKPVKTTLNAWKALERGDFPSPRGTNAVGPLMSTTWNQSPYYNSLCPGGSVTGCVATAMAQVMKYWDHPSQGTGFHSYNEDDYGTLSANFGSTSYDWASMPNDVSSSNNAVATLMYHCGVSVDMNYSPQVSGAYVVSAASPVQHCSEYAFTTYFGYDNSVQGVLRSNYTTNSWVNMLKSELDASRPILYAGFGGGGGHAFVCDGYDNNDFFHMNWGWGGAYDGFFTVDALDPSGVGTGGGSGGYNSGQQAVIGIKPPSGGGGGAIDLQLYDNLTVSPTTINYGGSFTVSTDIANFGGADFSGDFTAAAFDTDLNFVAHVEIKSGWSLASNNHYTNGISFSGSQILSMLPGTYYIGIFYRPSGGNWQVVADGNYANTVQINVVNPNDMELYSNMTPSPATFVQGQSASVNVDLVNAGNSTFYGSYGVGLFNLDGTIAQTIEVLNESSGLPVGFHYTNGINFSTNSITVDPGTYFLAVQHNPGSGWELTGSTNYQNPVYIKVVAAGLSPDAYENNDTEGNAYTLSVNFSGNSANVNTSGANSHNGSDFDYYKINLPSGYGYYITCRAHDSYNSGNGQTYTQDVLWSYNLDGQWSGSFDDVMSSQITVGNGGTLIFKVAPYFQGQTGTYLLDMDITRTNPIAIAPLLGSEHFRVYPNPVTDAIFLESDIPFKAERIEVLDVNGKTVKTQYLGTPLLRRKIEVADLRAGIYFLKLHSEESTWQQKFIKTN